jgi:response regulator RpfG family c-di-GMP phosphodiesterase
MTTSQSKSILVVDDDQQLLDGLARAHRKHFDIRTACGPEAGLAAIEAHGPFAVIVSDYSMPGMKGTVFLSKAKRLAPDSIRLMLTGNTESQIAIDAVNCGQIFRFLTKPCPNEVFAAAMNLAVEQYRLVTAERDLLQQTVRGAVQVLADVLSLVNPLAFSRALRAQEYVKQLVALLGLEDSWKYETAALLSQIGCVGVPEEVLERAASEKDLQPAERRMLDRHPHAGRDLIHNIPRLEELAAMVASQDDPIDGGIKGAPMGARILKVALDYDRLVTSGRDHAQTVETMRARRGTYEPSVLAVIGSLRPPGQGGEVRVVPISGLTFNMVLDEDVALQNGSLVVPRGQEVTASMVERLRNYAELGSIPGEVRVRLAGSHVPELHLTTSPGSAGE